MNIDREELRAVCYEVARSAMWAPRPVDVDKIEALATQFERIASLHCERVIAQGHDPNLIIRAVRYTGHLLKIPPMGRGASWFHSTLEVLIELACPTTQLEGRTSLFLDDLEKGLARARSLID